MQLSEVCLLTDDVRRLSAFYRQVLGIQEGGTDSADHQLLLFRGTKFAVHRDSSRGSRQSITLAFNVDGLEDMDRAYERAYASGAVILKPSTVDPLGVVSMSFLDPDGNLIHVHCVPQRCKVHTNVTYT